MTYNLYIDVLFLVNFVMDFLLLLILKKILKSNATVIRMILGSMAGAVWAVFITAFPILPRALEALVTYGLISSLMVILAFRLKGLRDIIKAVIGLYFSAITLGGAMYALYQHTRAGYYVEQIIQGNVTEAMPAYIFLLLITGTYFLTRYLWDIIFEIKKRKQNIYHVTLHYQGKSKCLTALMDTGNHLYEPVTQKPVHVITYEACKELSSSMKMVIYIPFQSVGTKEGMLPGVFMDSMEVEQGGQITVVEKPLIAVCKEQLSPGGEYQMLLHEEF